MENLQLQENEARLHSNIFFLSLCKKHSIICNPLANTNNSIYATQVCRRTLEKLTNHLLWTGLDSKECPVKDITSSPNFFASHLIPRSSGLQHESNIAIYLSQRVFGNVISYVVSSVSRFLKSGLERGSIVILQIRTFWQD